MNIFKRNKANRWLVLDQSFFAMFITFSLIELANVAAGLIDGLIVSNFLDAKAMAAAGIAHPIFSISGIFGGLFATGMQTLCTRALGHGDVRDFNRLFSAVMILGCGFSFVLTAVLLIGAAPLAMLLGASGKGAELIVPATQYLRGIGIGLPGLIMAGVLASAIQIDSGRKRVMTGALLYSGLNVLLDLAAVGLHLGMYGIGLATAVAQYLQIAYLLLYVRANVTQELEVAVQNQLTLQAVCDALTEVSLILHTLTKHFLEELSVNGSGLEVANLSNLEAEVCIQVLHSLLVGLQQGSNLCIVIGISLLGVEGDDVAQLSAVELLLLVLTLNV